MKYTENLRLPIYDNPEEDLFKIADHNNANQTVDDMAGVLFKIPETNATAEVIEAREGETTLGARMRNSIRVFNTVEEMKTNAHKLKEGQCVKTLGYYEPNDGGGAEYIYDGQDFKLINSLRPEVRIDVTNPPLSTELKPLTKDITPEERTLRLQAIFDYIGKNQTSYPSKKDGETMYTGYTYTVFFPNGIYELNGTINCKGSYLTIKSDRAIIKNKSVTGATFSFADSQGWNLLVEGLTFEQCNEPIKFTYYNTEMGNTTISKCWFINCTGYALYIDKQSQITKIVDCKFSTNEYDIYIKASDRSIIKDNWISIRGRKKDYDASIHLQSMRTVLQNNLFVPRPGSGAHNAYINNYGHLQILDNHFGGEPGSMALVNNYAKVTTVSPGNLNAPLLEIKGNTPCISVQDYTILRLFELPGLINIENNTGFPNGQKAIKWADTVTEDQQTQKINEVKQTLKVKVTGNVGFQMATAIADIIPKNLIPYSNLAYDKFIRKGEVITIQDNTITIDPNVSQGSGSLSYLVKLDVKGFAGAVEHGTITGVLSCYTVNPAVAKAVFFPFVNKKGSNLGDVGFNINITASFVQAKYKIVFSIDGGAKIQPNTSKLINFDSIMTPLMTVQ